MRPSVASDAVMLSVNLRPDDLAEVLATSGRLPVQVLVEGVRDSTECWTVTLDGHVMCMWGVVESGDTVLAGRSGCAWMLTSPLVETHAKDFWRACKAILPGVLDDWVTLTNWIDVRHEKAIRWATRLGFRLQEPEPFGVQGLPFRRFDVTKEDLNV